MLQPGQILLHPASTFFISTFESFHQAHSPAVFKNQTAPESSADIRKRVIVARAIQTKRFKRDKIFCNAPCQNPL
jgi:predicted ATPase with chaperone activity